MDTKACYRCEQTKPVDEFHISRQHAKGRHPWCKPCRAAVTKRYYEANTEKMIEAQTWRSMKHRYGITRDEYHALLDSQGGVCAICGRTPEALRRRLCVDHDHATGQVRGLLCTSCNSALGQVNDNPQTLLAAVAYLRRWVQSQ